MKITFIQFYSMLIIRAELYYGIVRCHHSPRVDWGGLVETRLCCLGVQGRTSGISLGMIGPPNIVNPRKQSFSLYPLPTTCYVLTLRSYTYAIYHCIKEAGGGICSTHVKRGIWRSWPACFNENWAPLDGYCFAFLKEIIFWTRVTSVSLLFIVRKVACVIANIKSQTGRHKLILDVSN